MNTRETTLLLTRPEPHSSKFLVQCERELGERVPAVISPLMQIVDAGDIPSLDAYETLIFTSGHAVHRVGKANLLKGRKVATVGQATAELAHGFGANAKAFGCDLETFLANSDALADPCLHLRGSHTRGDLCSRLNLAGRAVSEVIIYDQLAIPPSRAAKALIASGEPIIAPVFSPRSAQLLSRIIGQRADIVMIAMSAAVAAASGAGGKAQIAQAPTVEAMCRATTASLRQAYLVERPSDD